MDRLEPKTKKYYDQFYICPGCGRVYWRGSHCERMLARLKRAGVRVGP
ncbi:MAG: Mut7-C RNAse domain-containing protein [Elusimicrobia bacterium]|nr:Mut7-C RNAse domain-containing protein [Elusimicrobiota bacterium]